MRRASRSPSSAWTLAVCCSEKRRIASNYAVISAGGSSSIVVRSSLRAGLRHDREESGAREPRIPLSPFLSLRPCPPWRRKVRCPTLELRADGLRKTREANRARQGQAGSHVRSQEQGTLCQGAGSGQGHRAPAGFHGQEQGDRTSPLPSPPALLCRLLLAACTAPSSDERLRAAFWKSCTGSCELLRRLRGLRGPPRASWESYEATGSIVEQI